MKNLFLLFVLFLCGCCTINSGLSPKEIIKSNYSVQLFADTLDGDETIYASGFAINKDFIVTVGHFCVPIAEGEEGVFFDENIKMKYTTLCGNILKKEGIYIDSIDESKDICLLKKENHGIKPIEFTNKRIDIGERIAISGGPSSWYPSVSFGHITDPDSSLVGPIHSGNGVISGSSRIILTVHTCGGNSGSPVILIDEGSVAGMVYAGPTECGKISFGVTAKDIKDFLKEHGQQFLEGKKR